VDVRIDVQTRETAALLCQLMASNNDNEPGGWFVPVCDVLGESCWSGDASLLARSCYWRAPRLATDSEPVKWARAEALLRTGWSP